MPVVQGRIWHPHTSEIALTNPKAPAHCPRTESESQLGKTPGPALSPLHLGFSSVRGPLAYGPGAHWVSMAVPGLHLLRPSVDQYTTQFSTGGWHAVSHR